MAKTACGTFEIVMTPAPPEVEGAVGRFDFTKTFHGDLQAKGAGVMLSCGDPQSGAAGYARLRRSTAVSGTGTEALRFSSSA